MREYYFDDQFHKRPVDLTVNFSFHADRRAYERGFDKRRIRENVRKNLKSIMNLENNSDFKVYAMNDFMVIPGKIFYSKNKNKAYILIKTVFSAPKPLTHYGEKTIISA